MAEPAPGNFRFRVTPGFAAHLFKAVAKQHHRELIPLLRPLVPADAIVFDVGAHAGQFAKLFARVAPRGTVYAVEPGRYARFILRAALRLNRIRNVAVLPCALGDRPGVSLLTVPVKRSGSYGFGLAHLGAGTREAETELVPVATLDDTVASLGLQRLDFIKADIEGYEHRLILGARATLARFRPALLLEMNEAHLARAGGSLAALWALLIERGYQAYAPTPERTPIAAPAPGDVLWLHRG